MEGRQETRRFLAKQALVHVHREGEKQWVVSDASSMGRGDKPEERAQDEKQFSLGALNWRY